MRCTRPGAWCRSTSSPSQSQLSYCRHPSEYLVTIRDTNIQGHVETRGSSQTTLQKHCKLMLLECCSFLIIINYS
jgi:hypothetical protein